MPDLGIGYMSPGLGWKDLRDDKWSFEFIYLVSFKNWQDFTHRRNENLLEKTMDEMKYCCSSVL